MTDGPKHWQADEAFVAEMAPQQKRVMFENIVRILVETGEFQPSHGEAANAGLQRVSSN